MNNNLKLTIVISLLVALFITDMVYILESLTPKIVLKNEIITLKLGEHYNEPGYEGKTLIKNLTNLVTTKNDIKIDKVGVYHVNYELDYGISTVRVNRKVRVIDDIKPTITLSGENPIALCPKQETGDYGYNAIDNYDGDITDKVVIVKEENQIIYNITDSSGNKASASRKIIREDSTKPILYLYGYSTVYVYTGYTYTEPGYNASDNCAGDLTSQVIVTGNVNTNVNGTYQLVYTVTDDMNNSTSVTRNIVVFNKYSGGNGKIYLTFDDGPSASITPLILNILNEEGIKATFFVTNKSSNLDYLIIREHNEGHTVGLHSSTHNYKTIYSSSDAYFYDLSVISNKVKLLTGIDSKIIRFPGGSSNIISKNYSIGIMSYLTQEVTRRGYRYFDWNVSSQDAAGAKSKEQVYYNVIKDLSHSKTNVVLMHDYDGNYITANALRDIIKYGRANGYSFEAITMNTPQIIHKVAN